MPTKVSRFISDQFGYGHTERISVATLTTVHHMTSGPNRASRHHVDGTSDNALDASPERRENSRSGDEVVVRRARTSDIPEIKRLIDIYAGKILLEKNLVTLYEAVQEFWVAERGDSVIGCGALHVLWADLGEVRTVAVDPAAKGLGAGRLIVDTLIRVARDLALQKLFVLTFEVDFFTRHGFLEIEGTPVTAEVYAEMCRSYDTGVAEFLDLSYVKPNTLGNTRMLLPL